MPTTAPIRTGIVGFGLSGRVFHGPFVEADPAFRLDLISTSDPGRAADAHARHPGAEVVATAGELLARAGDLDLVVLASPVYTHLEQGLAALDAGANLVIDKPFTRTVVDAKNLIAKAEAAGKVLAVFQNRRWDGDFLTVKRLLAEGVLGDIHRFESTFERWSGPLRDRWQDTMTVEQGAGITYDLGSHLVDQALQLFGPATVEQAELQTVRRGSVSDDDAFLSLLHSSGVRSHLTMSRAAGRSGPRFRVLGSNGAYSVTGLDPQEAALRAERGPDSDGYGVTPESDWGLLGTGDDLTPVPTEVGAYPAFYAGLATSILTGAPAPVDPREALEVVRIIERAHALSTAAAGRPVARR